MKHFVLAGAAVLALSGPALAGGMDNAVGHTVRVTAGEDGFDAWFHADGAYSDSRGLSGSWSYDEQLCVTVSTEEGPQTSCGPWNPDLSAGESWSTTGWSEDGSAITVQIVAS